MLVCDIVNTMSVKRYESSKEKNDHVYFNSIFQSTITFSLKVLLFALTGT